MYLCVMPSVPVLGNGKLTGYQGHLLQPYYGYGSDLHQHSFVMLKMKILGFYIQPQGEGGSGRDRA